MTDEKKSLITFPTDFTIKVFGNATDDFEATILAMVQKHAPAASKENIVPRASANGKYVALSITIYVDSQAQLDKIYQDLSTSPSVLMAL